MLKRKAILSAILGVALLAGTMFASFAPTFTQAAEAPERDTNATFYNDAQFRAADPHVLYDKESGYYYSYSTDGAKSGYRFGIYRSADLTTWEQLNGAIPTNDPNQWANDWFWAPECYYNENNGYYYLFYSGRMTQRAQADRVKEHFGFEDFEEACKTGVAVSKSPEGPFYNITDEPIDYFPYDPDYYDVNQIMDSSQMAPPTFNLAESDEDYSHLLGVYLPFIDANVFFDDDGQIYLYYSRNAYRNWVWDTDLEKYIEESNIYVVPLTTDWWYTADEPVMPTIDPDEVNANKEEDDESGRRKDGFYPAINYGSDKQGWENGHTNDYEVYNGGKKDRRWAEGSTTMKHYYTDENGVEQSVYYIIYSCNNYENEFYGEGYATSDSPLGPWKKSASNPIVAMDKESNPPIYSTGHGSFIASPDGTEMFHVYHARPSTSSTRYMYTNKFNIEDDNLDSDGYPSLSVDQVPGDQAIPSGVAPYSLNVGASSNAEGDDTINYNISLGVRSNDGGSLNLANPANRVNVEISDPDLASYENGVLKVAKEGTVTVTYTYQRKQSNGTYFNVYNIDEDGDSYAVQRAATYVNGVVQERTLNTNLLDYTINKAESVMDTDEFKNLIDDVAKAFTDRFNTAKQVSKDAKASNPSVTQDDIDKAAEKLMEAFHYLDFVKADISDLKKLIATAETFEANEAEYTVRSFAPFKETLDKARELAKDGNLLAGDPGDEAKIQAMEAELFDAIFDLRFIPNKAKLQELLGEAEKVNVKLYTASTVKVFQEAQTAAEKVMADPDVEQSEVDEAVEKLDKGIKGLVRLNTGGNNGGNNNNGNNGDNGNNNGGNGSGTKGTTTAKSNPKTGDNNVAPVFALIAAAGFVTIILKKKSK